MTPYQHQISFFLWQTILFSSLWKYSGYYLQPWYVEKCTMTYLSIDCSCFLLLEVGESYFYDMLPFSSEKFSDIISFISSSFLTSFFFFSVLIFCASGLNVYVCYLPLLIFSAFSSAFWRFIQFYPLTLIISFQHSPCQTLKGLHFFWLLFMHTF